MPEAIRADEVADLVALIVSEQGRPERMIPSLGDDVDAVRAEIVELVPPWPETVRVVRNGDGAVVGAVIVELDAELRQAWIHGPWVAGHDDAWDRFARPLVDAALAQVPETITRRTISGRVEHARLAALARQLGWAPGSVNHVLLAERSLVDAWPEDLGGAVVRLATADDLAPVEVLHEAEFPDTYATAAQLLQGGGDHAPVVLVAEMAGPGVVGYAAGRIQADGEAYIDFVSVSPDARGAGVGRRLVVALGRELVRRASKDQLCLSVRDERTAARALYAQLGFRTLFSMVGYGAGIADGPSDKPAP